MSDVEGILTFNGYYAEDVRYFRKVDDQAQREHVDEKLQITLSPVFDFGVAVDPNDPHEANVILSVEFKEEDNLLLPFYLLARIRGFFTVTDGSADPSVCDRIFRVNAVAVLFPYLRSLVSDITSKCDYLSPIILPTINVTKLFEKMKR